jgi:hypothetical protein
VTDVTTSRDKDGMELSAADEQLLHELTERARTGGLRLTGEGGGQRRRADDNVSHQLQAETLLDAGLISRYRVPPAGNPLTGARLSRCSISTTEALAAAPLHRVCQPKG